MGSSEFWWGHLHFHIPNYALSLVFYCLFGRFLLSFFLPPEVIAANDYLDSFRRFNSAPIVSINLWYREPITDLEFVSLLDSKIEWVFNKNAIAIELAETFGDFAFAEAFPAELRDTVDDGGSGIQRFSFAGKRYIAVGIHLAAPDADYFEAFPLRSTERSLRSLLIAFSIGSAATVALASAIGVWTSRRLMKPLARITDAATQIASGDLDTRVAPEHDRDLEPLVRSFNGMADAVQKLFPEEGIYAARTDVDPPPGSLPIAQIKLIPVDYEQIEKDAAALKKRFNEIYQ